MDEPDGISGGNTGSLGVLVPVLVLEDAVSVSEGTTAWGTRVCAGVDGGGRWGAAREPSEPRAEHDAVIPEAESELFFAAASRGGGTDPADGLTGHPGLDPFLVLVLLQPSKRGE